MIGGFKSGCGCLMVPLVLTFGAMGLWALGQADVSATDLWAVGLIVAFVAFVRIIGRLGTGSADEVYGRRDGP